MLLITHFVIELIGKFIKSAIKMDFDGNPESSINFYSKRFYGKAEISRRDLKLDDRYIPVVNL